ncbi:MAG: serine acetyltransferase [Desulfovibrionaceae bacterium]|jgi:serine O-acetyltransferase|nr:serine acetyltransferase [Desulfovibrionaceae bacterium]
MTRDRILDQTVNRLCDAPSFRLMVNRLAYDKPMPSVDALASLVDLLRSVLFPGYFGDSHVSAESQRYAVGSALNRAAHLLTEQVERGYCFVCTHQDRGACEECRTRAQEVTLAFLERLPEVRDLLALDVEAAFDGDPAAKNHGEVIFCYPSIRALTNHRIAHELYKLGVDVIPRIIGEMAHAVTGIDIHPGARIGRRFFIDHGTGTVIGETTIIGDNVRIYQGVTLGAKSFPKDEKDRLVKGLPRHPIVEDDVIIYSNATVLGRVTIGKGAVVGGNTWITTDVPAGARISQPPRENVQQVV